MTVRKAAAVVAAVLALQLGLRMQAPRGRVRAESEAITWRRQVAPLVYSRCSGCHHAGGSGPFDLTTYASAKRWGPQIAEVVSSRYMPPWLPEQTGGPVPVHFEGDRHLRSAEIELLTSWVKAGMPEGGGPEPARPVYRADWQLGPPDLILEMPAAVSEPASGSDLFVNFILPVNITGTRWVRALEIQPGAGQLVHHANLVLDRTASLRAHHPSDWQAGIPGMDLQIDSGDTFDPDSHFLFWKPDSTALVEPPGMPWRLDPGNDLILNMHLKPTGKPEEVRARVGLYFTPQPATAHPLLVQLEHDRALDIPAGDAHFAVSDELRLPVAVDVLGVYPHAHYLCREMEGWATLPGGETQPLLSIKDWDIDRQSVYRLAKPLRLPKGTVLHMRYVYDNSAANVHNPHTPPARVQSGNRATDEMGHLWLQVLPVAEGPADARYPVERAWMESVLRKSPADPIALYNLGALSQMEGQPQEAQGYFRRLLAEHPQDARALTSLGSALEAAGNGAGARAQFRAAMLADPGYTDATYDLAQSTLRAGELTEAEALFRRLLADRPKDEGAADGLAECLLERNRVSDAELVLVQILRDDAGNTEAHRLLAMAYAADGDATGAVTQLRDWAKLAPAQPEAHRALGQVLSASGQAEEALAEQHAVLRLTGENAGDWSDLGTMAARAGHLTEARAAFEHALRIEPQNRAARANLEKLRAGSAAR